MKSDSTELYKNTMYLAAIIEKKIIEYKGVMPLSEQKIFALNLGGLITLAKEMGVKKSDIVVASGVRHNKDAPVNILNSYCILAEGKVSVRLRPVYVLTLKIISN